MRVLITHSAEDTAASIAALESRGHQVTAIPLVTVARTPDPKINLTGAQGFLVTSAEGARALAAHVGVRTFPVFADSDVTADALRRLGFKHIETANDDAADLARLVERTLKPANGALIYASSTTAAVNLPAMLSNMGFAVRPLPLYTIKRVEQTPAALRAALENQAIDTALFLAPDEARAFVALIQRDELEPLVRTLTAVAATPAVAAPLRALKLGGVTVSTARDLDTLFNSLSQKLVDRVAEERTARERRAKEEADAAAAQERIAAEHAAQKAAAERAEQERLAQEKAAAEQAERARVEQKRQELERAVQEREAKAQAERERIARERAEKERLAAEKAAAEKAQRERLAAEKAEQDRIAQAHAAAARAEQERLTQARAEQDRLERERLAAEKAERDRIAAEKAAVERAEKERLAREQAERDRLERERLAAERAERERIAREKAAADKAERERLAAEQAERDRIERGRQAAERAERERLAQEEIARAKSEKDRIALEKAEQARVERERLAVERAEKDRLVREKAAAEKAERDRVAAEKAEQDRIQRERLAEEKAERDRVARERAAAERAEKERLAAEEAERKRLEAERVAAERAERDRIARETAAAEKIERDRIVAEKTEQDRIERERLAAERAERERIARETAAKAKAEKLQANAEQAALNKAEKERLALEKAAAKVERQLRVEEEKARRAAKQAQQPPRESLGQRVAAWFSRPRSTVESQTEIWSMPVDTATDIPPPKPVRSVVAEPSPSATLTTAYAAPDVTSPDMRPKPKNQARRDEPQTKETKTVSDHSPPPNMHTGDNPADKADATPATAGEGKSVHRGGGRAARLLAEDAADQRAEGQRFKYLGHSEPAPEQENTERQNAAFAATQRSGGGARVVLLFVVLVILAGAVFGTASWWVPRVTSLTQATPMDSPAALQADITALKARIGVLEQEAVNTVTPDTLKAAKQDIEKRLAALEARAGTAAQTNVQANEQNSEAVTSLGDSLASQAKQLTAVSARLATLEAAIGNSARLEDLSKRLNMLEGRTAEAHSVLALSDRVTALETTGRRTMVEQSANIALLMAVGQWREALLAGKPFALELQTTKALAARVNDMTIDDASFAAAAAQGLPTLVELQHQFGPAAAAAMRASAMPDGAGAWSRRILDRMMAIITVRRLDGDAAGTSTAAVLARAESRLNAGDLAAAVTEMKGLSGGAATAADAWQTQATARVAAEAAAAEAATKAVAAMTAAGKAPEKAAPAGAAGNGQ